MKIPATKQIMQKTLIFALTAILLLSAIAQVSAQGNPPAINITEFSFTPSTIDTTSSSQTVTVTVRVTNTTGRDVVAIQTGFSSPADTQPIGTQFVSVSLNSADRISGNSSDGVYRKAVIFPQYSKGGIWRVNSGIAVTDSAFSRSFFSISTLAARGFVTQLQVINNNEAIPPEISEFSFTPSTIDTTNGSQNVTITLRVTDAASGVSSIGVSFILAEGCDFDGCELYDAQGVNISSANRISGDAKDGVYRIVHTFPQNFVGTYYVFVRASDALGNSKSLNSEQLAARGFSSQLRVTARPKPFDFDGDRRADISVFNPSNGVWYVQQSQNGGHREIQFGRSGDKITPADFDGDGRTDIAVFRDGTWFWLNSSNGAFNSYQFGLANDIPVPADYTGDGRAELAVYRSGFWYTLNLANNQFQSVQFGLATDRTVPADYDGDGLADFAVYRDGMWYLLRSSQGFAAVQFGLSTDKPTVGDYDADGKADQAVYRDGTWYILGSTQGFSAVQFGLSSDVPVAADYDGDGKTDVAVFRDGVWYLLRSQQGFNAVRFGTTTDQLIPASFVP